MTTTTLAAADLTLRPATLDDAAFAADMWTAGRPDDPEDPVLTRYYWEHPGEQQWQRFIAMRGSERVGLCAQGHPSWADMPERWGRTQAELIPAVRTTDRLAALLGAAEDRARADGARHVTAWAWEDDATLLAALERRGFTAKRRARFWELDLRARRDALREMAERSRASMRDQGIEVTTLDRIADPERHRKLWRMSEEASQDTPRTVPWTPTPFEAFEEWLRNPAVREDRMHVARVGDAVVGISVLGYPPVRGVVVTEWTATARSVRGKGVARALKLETVMQAVALGIDRVRTDNDSQNAPILHLNESMGYRIRGEMIQHIKDL